MVVGSVGGSIISCGISGSFFFEDSLEDPFLEDVFPAYYKFYIMCIRW